MGKISEKQNLKRINIIDSAYELFISKSFAATSIDDIVRKAGIAKGTFYLYFKDKYDLMDRIVAHKTFSVLSDALDCLNREKEKTGQEMSFLQQMMFIIDNLVNYMQENRELLTLVDKKFSKYITAFYSLGDEILKDRVDSIITLNEKNGVSKADTMKKIYLTVDLIGSVCSDAIIYEKPFRLEEIKPFLFASAEKILA